jgi:Zn-dependent protease with chaperone function
VGRAVGQVVSRHLMMMMMMMMIIIIIIIMVTLLRNKPSGYGATVAAAAGPFNKIYFIQI